MDLNRVSKFLVLELMELDLLVNQEKDKSNLMAIKH